MDHSWKPLGGRQGAWQTGAVLFASPRWVVPLYLIPLLSYVIFLLRNGNDPTAGLAPDVSYAPAGGVLVAPEMPAFMPVQMLETPRPAMPMLSSPPRPAPPARPSSGLIEIELGNGQQVRVGNDVNLAALRRVLAALRG